MSYIGQAALKNSELKRFDVTSSTSATHVLSWTAPNEQSLWITINGVKQQDDAYSIAGSPTTITLTDPLVATDKMEVIGVVDIGVITIVGDNSVDSNKLADNAVTTGKILDGTIVNADLSASAAIAVDKLETGTRGDILFWAADTEASRLAAGASGLFLKTQGSGADPVWSSIPVPTGGGSDSIFYQNGQTVTTDYTVTASNNAMSAGPVSVNTGVNITLTGTSEWVIV